MKNWESTVMAALVIGLLLMSGCALSSSDNNSTQEKPLVITTFYPLTDLTKALVGNEIEVTSLVPAGVEPHDYEPTPSDLAAARVAKAFVTLGLEFENIEDQLLKDSNAVQIEAAKGITLLDAVDDPEQGEDGEEQEEAVETHESKEFGKDPHIWLSPRNMIQMTANVKDGLVQAFPQRRQTIEENAAIHIAKLEALDAAFKQGLKNCDKRIILVNHRAFAYLAHDYAFKQITIAGLSPEIEPSPQELAALIDAAKEHNLKYILYEELVDPRVAKTIASDVGAQILLLSPIEGNSNPEQTYISLMEMNLEHLRLAMGCE